MALGILLTLMPDAALPQNAADSGSIRYIFRTLLVPDQPAERSPTVSKNDPWFSGKAVPVRAMALDADIPITGAAIVLSRGAVLSVADSDHLIACQREVVLSAGVGGMGRSPVCLVDLDRDGRFDGWFKSSINLIWGCCNGHLQRSRVRPIAPAGATELSPDRVRALDPWGYFSIRYAQGMLTYCLGISDVCQQKAPRIKPSEIEQTTEFMGGLFGYRKLENGKLAVRMIRDPQEATY
ncbi:MAG: hypothetical protein WC729_26845 [Sphingomonas sp.]|uniref:hypothetical protein n=1 Tax=Sphingomonas sp. TaxID=28214 RepID=UPI0035648590